MARDWRDSYDTVRVWTRTQAGTDPMGDPVYEWDFTDVAGVSVKTGPSTDVVSGEPRPEGVEIAYTLAFPKGHGLALRHARVTFLNPVRRSGFCTSEDWEVAKELALPVVGDPEPQRPCPTRWDTLCEVGRVDG